MNERDAILFQLRMAIRRLPSGTLRQLCEPGLPSYYPAETDVVRKILANLEAANCHLERRPRKARQRRANSRLAKH